MRTLRQLQQTLRRSAQVKAHHGVCPERGAHGAVVDTDYGNEGQAPDATLLQISAVIHIVLSNMKGIIRTLLDIEGLSCGRGC